MSKFEIVDEGGNIHGPFETSEQIAKCVDDLALGEGRDEDDEIGRGWFLRPAKSAR